MSWYRKRVERDLARWQTAGWVSEAGAAAIRADLAIAQAAVRRGADPGHPRCGAVRLCCHELRRGQLERDVASSRGWRCCWGRCGPATAARPILFARQLERLRARGRARRHRRVRRQHHADRADVPHGGQPAGRRAAVGAGRAAGRRASCAPTRRWPPPSCCWRCGRGWSAASTSARTGSSCRRGQPPPLPPPGSAGGPACTWPR